MGRDILDPVWPWEEVRRTMIGMVITAQVEFKEDGTLAIQGPGWRALLDARDAPQSADPLTGPRAKAQDGKAPSGPPVKPGDWYRRHPAWPIVHLCADTDPEGGAVGHSCCGKPIHRDAQVDTGTDSKRCPSCESHADRVGQPGFHKEGPRLPTRQDAQDATQGPEGSGGVGTRPEAVEAPSADVVPQDVCLVQTRARRGLRVTHAMRVGRRHTLCGHHLQPVPPKAPAGSALNCPGCMEALGVATVPTDVPRDIQITEVSLVNPSRGGHGPMVERDGTEPVVIEEEDRGPGYAIPAEPVLGSVVYGETGNRVTRNHITVDGVRTLCGWEGGVYHVRSKWSPHSLCVRCCNAMGSRGVKLHGDGKLWTVEALAKWMIEEGTDQVAVERHGPYSHGIEEATTSGVGDWSLGGLIHLRWYTDREVQDVIDAARKLAQGGAK